MITISKDMNLIYSLLNIVRAATLFTLSSRIDRFIPGFNIKKLFGIIVIWKDREIAGVNK